MCVASEAATKVPQNYMENMLVWSDIMDSNGLGFMNVLHACILPPISIHIFQNIIWNHGWISD